MTLEEVAHVAPSVLTREKAPTLFNAYEHVGSWEVIEALMDSGYGISRAQQIDVKADGLMKRFSKHIVCLRPMTAFRELHRGEYIPEIVFRAAHDGSSAIHMSNGLFRVVCSNGMMVSEGKMNSFRIPHKSGAREAAIRAAYAIVESSTRLDAKVEEMQARELTEDEQWQFARSALPLRFEKDANRYDPSVLLTSRRVEDAGNNLWRVLNRIQENLTKGGFPALESARRPTVTREVGSITLDVAINTGVWALAEELL